MGACVRPYDDHLPLLCALRCPIRTDRICQCLQAVLGNVTAAHCVDALNTLLKCLRLLRQIEKVSYQHRVCAVGNIISECYDADAELAHMLSFSVHQVCKIAVEIQGVLLDHVDDPLLPAGGIFHASCGVNAEDHVHGIVYSLHPLLECALISLPVGTLICLLVCSLICLLVGILVCLRIGVRICLRVGGGICLRINALTECALGFF